MDIGTKKEKLWYLKSADLFSELSFDSLKELDRLSAMKSVPKRTTLYFPNQPSDSLFLLKEGRVKIFRLSEEGREIILDFLGPGEIFGELSLADEPVRTASAETVEDSLVCTLPAETFRRFLSSRPELAFRIIKLMGLRRRELESRIEDLVFRSVPSRIAGLLLKLIEKHGEPSPGGVQIKLRLTHEEIAHLIGATRETVTEELNRLRHNRIIDFEKRRIIVCRKDWLTELSHPR